jgi:hypothetical protein
MKRLFITLLLTLTLLTPPVHAAPSANSKQQAIEIAQQQFPGRVLSVKQKNDSYHVKILNTQGDVRIIKVRASEQPAKSSR